jgi:hypothetical protein
MSDNQNVKVIMLDQETRRKNRILVWILIAIMAGMATWGTLYLRHYGFNTSPSTERYH